MKLTKYPEYFNTGLDWLGHIPSNWQLKRLGTVFKERREKVSDTDYPALSVTKSGIVPQLENAAKTDAGDNRKRVAVGDFVINSRSDRKGSSGLSALDGSVSLISIVLQPTGINGAYAHYLLRSQPFQEEFYRFGKGIVADLWSTNYSEMKNISLPMPDDFEQTRIAAFLYRETGKIDRLIEKQQRLIELLEEKRQAVISHAVKLRSEDKSSRLSHYVSLTSGFAFPSSEFSHDASDVRLLRGVNIGVGDVRWSDVVYWPSGRLQEVIDFGLNPGDIVFGMDRPWISSGARVAWVKQEDIPSLLVQRVARLRARNSLNQSYLYFILSSNEFKSYIEVDLTGVSVPHISPDQIKNFKFRVMPEEQQQAVVSELKLKLDKIDRTITKAKHCIGLLKERRTTLISAAVTGKIDVRDQVPQDVEEAVAS